MLKKLRRESHTGRKYLQPKIYKEFLELNNKKTNNLIF